MIGFILLLMMLTFIFNAQGMSAKIDFDWWNIIDIAAIVGIIFTYWDGKKNRRMTKEISDENHRIEHKLTKQGWELEERLTRQGWGLQDFQQKQERLLDAINSYIETANRIPYELTERLVDNIAISSVDRLIQAETRIRLYLDDKNVYVKYLNKIFLRTLNKALNAISELTPESTQNVLKQFMPAVIEEIGERVLDIYPELSKSADGELTDNVLERLKALLADAGFSTEEMSPYRLGNMDAYWKAMPRVLVEITSLYCEAQKRIIAGEKIDVSKIDRAEALMKLMNGVADNMNEFTQEFIAVNSDQLS